MREYVINYSPVGDLLTVAVCIGIILLMRVAYVSHTANFRLFRASIHSLILASLTNVAFHMIMEQGNAGAAVWCYVFRAAYHACLFTVFLLYVFYALSLMQVEERVGKAVSTVSVFLLVFLILYDVLGEIFGYSFHIGQDGAVTRGFNIFPIGHAVFTVLLLLLILNYRRRVYHKVVTGICSSAVLSYLMLMVQGIFGRTSFTTATFLFPTFALFYLVHSTPYDINTGSVSINAFSDFVRYHHKRGKRFVLVSILVPECNVSGRRIPEELQEKLRHFIREHFPGGVLFRLSGGHLILAVPRARNPEFEKWLDVLHSNFEGDRSDTNLTYKMVFLDSVDEISEKNDYLEMIDFFEDKADENLLTSVEEADVEAYRKYRYIVKELADIHAKRDMYDPRVAVYCQPVYNLQTQSYDTAEALMRLKLEKCGMVFPDQFIPVAEKFNYIPVLSLIILSKTCACIRSLLDEGYYVRRISVNFSMIDVREPDFAVNVNRVVAENNIPYDKVALELTESQNEKDFRLVKERIEELKGSGMKFYLDDFGTGYSSFERIVELPFDIIKFDRSLVIASATDIKAETMVDYLAHMFSDMNYSVLYEGIEDETDEERCARMCAKYLQGYKYSKPIPIEKLTEYFSKEK
ncbi:MAG: EAL domain-containing protein [Lachnospiraceae bacterium]|nr:EAL domain-containing protein [Lachnospiraceae bacterium]